MAIRIFSLLLFQLIILFKVSRQFSEETIKFAVSEDAPINSIIGQLKAQNGLTYRLSRGNSKIRFDDQTLEFSVSSALDRESEDAIDMLVITSPPSIIHILIDILDVNDNAPKFPIDIQKVEIPETAPIGWRVSISGATDPDDGRNGTIGGYELRETIEEPSPEDTKTPFSVVQADGFVFLEVTGSLDREQRDLYSMKLTATDQGSPPRSASCLVNIVILDTNDNPPDFGIRSISVDWNGQPSTSVLFRLNASDADSGDNGLVKYRILGAASDYFSISDGDSLVTRNNTADACLPRCEFVVEARDSGVPALTTTLNVAVSVAYGNEHEPNINIRFYPADFPFIVVQPEDVNGKTLAILSITDADGPLGDNASIWIESGNEEAIFSLISRQSINILTLKNVENAKREQYVLEFGASDGQKPAERKSRKTLKVFFSRFVKPSNVSVDREFHVDLEKDTVPGSFVAHVLTNCSEMCSFELTNSDIFKIDSTNGIIVTTAELPEDVTSYHLPVRVRLPPPSTKFLETDVFVKIIKEAVPKSLIRTAQTTVHLKRAYTFATWHNVSVGTVVGRLPRAQVYSTSDVQSELGIFPDGAIFVGKQVNSDIVTLPVTLENRNTTQKSLITVVVRRANEHAPSCDVTEIRLSEDVPAGSFIGRLHASDPDSGADGVVSFRLLNSENDVIHVDPSTGNVRSKVRFDAERKENFTFSYQVSDFGSPKRSTNCTGTILVEDVNDNAPKFGSRYYSAKISGTQNTPVVIVHADDEDVTEKNRRIQYRLLNFNDYFHVETDSGKLKTIQNLPRTFRRLNLTIEAVNGDSENFLASTTFILVTVMNSTDLDVSLKSEDVIRIHKNDVAGTRVARIEMTSSDSVFWGIKDPRFFMDVSGNVILRKATSSSDDVEIVVRSASGVKRKFKHRVEILDSDRNDNAREMVEVVVDSQNTNDSLPILNLAGNSKNWKIARVISESDGTETDRFFVANQTLFVSGNASDSFVFLESSDESEDVPNTSKFVHVVPSTSSDASDRSGCFSSVHLITPPATVALSPNCTDVVLQNQKPLQMHEGSLLIPSQTEMVSHVDLVSRKKPFMMTLIRDSPTEEVKFASNNVLMLLSSVHNIGSSFGRVTAESAYRIRYYLVGTSKVSIDADTGELFLKERFYRNLNDIQIIAVIPTGISKAKVTIEVIEDRLHLPKSNFLIFAPNSLHSDSPLGSVSVGRDDVILDVIDEHFYIRRSEVFAKKHFVPTSNFYDLEGVVKKGKLSTPINVTIFFGDSGGNEWRENELKFELEENSPIGTVVGVVPNNHSKYRLVDPTCGLLIDQDGVIRTTTSFDREKTSLLKTKMIEPAANRIWDLLVFIGDVNDNKPKIVNAPGRIEVTKGVQKVYKFLWEDADDVASDVHFAIVDGDPFGHLEVLDSGDVRLKSTPSESFNATLRIYDNRPPFAVNFDDVTIEFHVADPARIIGCVDQEVSVFGDVPRKGDVVTAMKTVTSSEKVTWRIVPSSLPNTEFFVESVTGRIILNTDELKSGDVFNLRVQVISYDSERTAFCDSKITIQDLTSSEAPKFQNKTYEFSVGETTDRGTAIGRVCLETDSDDVVFRLLNDFNFTISPFDGTIFTNSPLDYEDVKTYELHVAAERAGSPVSHADVFIKVADENDESPRFITGDVVHLSVREEETTVHYPLIIGSSIAEDVDEGQNGVVTYSLLSGNTSLFAVNSTTGDILSLGPLDREESDLYELLIEAKDAGIPSLTATSRILIHVEDVNDNAPEFTQTAYFVRIPENLPSGSRILRIQATDKDRNAELQYSLVDDVAPFRIDVATGWITVAGRVDREEKDKYEMSVFVRDGEKRSESHVTVLVEDVNDNAPVIENENVDVFVPDDVAEGDLLFVVDVHDADQKDRLKFSLNGTDSHLFTVTENGEILARQSGLTTKSFFSIVVTVTDDVDHSTSSEFTFYLHSRNEFPIWKEKMDSASVREHESQELAVFKAKGQGVRYSIVSRCKEHLSIESITGILSTKASLDREQFAECPVFVVATSFLDNKPLSVITKMVIKVVDINDNSPMFDEQLYRFNVSENSGPSSIGRIQARDADDGDNARIYYEIVGGDRNHEFIVTENGDIETIRDLDRESEAEYRLIVEAIDDGKPRRRGNTTVVVKVLDEDDNAPRFSRIFHVEIPEDSRVGDFVIQLSASDADETANHRFALEGEEMPFRVEEESGKVFVNDTLDYEKKSSYRIKVRLTDGVWLIETSLFVTLKDVNDNFPEFEKEEYFFVSEDSMEVGTVRASDRDSGDNGKIRYSVTSPFFRIDPESGVITKLRPLPEAMTSLEVTASDHGVPRLQRTARVHVAEKTRFWEVKEEKIRETAKKEDVVGTGISTISQVFPRGAATVTNGGSLILKTKQPNDFWILENSTMITYTVVRDSEPIESRSNESVHVEVSATSPIGEPIIRIRAPGCSNFEPLKRKNGFRLEKNGDLRMVGTNENETTLEVTCNDGDWPRRNQIMEIVVRIENTPEPLPTLPKSSEDKRIQKILPKTLKLSVPAGTHSGSILWHNENHIPLSMEPSSMLILKHGNLILKSSLDSEKTILDVFGPGFRRCTVTIVPDEEAVACPVFPQDFFFFETSHSSEIHDFGWKFEKCRIEVQKEFQSLFHTNGSQLTSLVPLAPGTYQFSLSLLESDGSIRSECHVAVTVPADDPAERLVPSAVFFRENVPSSPQSPLFRLPSTHTLADDSVFSVTDSGAVWSRSALRSTSRSVYRIPVLEKKLKKQDVVRVLLDDVAMDSEDVDRLEFHVIGNEKTILNLDVSNGNRAECFPKNGENFELTENCHVIIPNSHQNVSIPVTSSNTTWSVDVINERNSEDVKLQKNAIELEFFGKKSSISHLIQDLTKIYDDMKIRCLAAWQTSEDVKFRVVFAMIDRNDVIVEASEARRTMTSFLEKHRPNYLDLIGFRTDQCDGVTCIQKNSTCQTVLEGSSRRLVSKSGSLIFDLPEKKLAGRCKCVEGMECEEDVRRTVLQKTQKDDVILSDAPRRTRNCDDVDCGSDGECILEESTPICRCRDEKKAFESMFACGKALEAFSMTSGGHLELAVKNSSLLKCQEGCEGVQQIEMDFRTIQTHGELIVVDFGKQKATVEIIDGYVSFSLSDEFTRPIQTRIEKRISDGRWHRLLLQMSDEGKKISIQVDGRGKEVKSRVSLPMMFTATALRVVTSPDFCFRRLLAQNQFVHPVLVQNKMFHVSSFPTSSVSATCSFDPSPSRSGGFFSNFSDTTTLVLLTVLAVISLIGLSVCLLAIRRRWLQKTASGNETESSGWRKASEIDAFAVHRPPHRGHVNRSMLKSPDDDTYEVATVFGAPMKTTSTDDVGHVYTSSSASRRYQPSVARRRDGHINMAYL